jgi:molecular chaperone GrpE
MGSKLIYNAPAMVDKNELHDDDIVLEEDDESAQDQDLELEAEEELTAEKFKKLRAKLKESESEKMSALEEMGRIRADFLNSKRRLEEQFKTDRERIIERVVEDFIPLIDSFETALAQKGGSEGGQWADGVKAMHGQFLSILKSYNITEIETEGKQFNPHEHDAVTARKGENGEATDTVLQVLQKGYKRGDTIIRPAKVVIAE